MKHRSFLISVVLTAAFLLTLSPASPAIAQGGLQTINAPQGGKIMYGQVQGQTTEADAMAAILRSLHQSLGERPQVGKLFDVKGTDSVATFFTVTRHDQGTGQGAGQGSLKVAGLLIATKVSTDHVEAALVSDDAARFPKTLSPMMKTLMSVWHPLAGAASAAGAPGSAPAELHRVVTQDRSAAIGLPNGWQIFPRSGGGSLVAMGPHGETAEMDSTFLAGDTNNPNVQRTMRTVQSGGLRNTAYSNGTYYPYGANQAKTFVDLAQESRRKGRLPAANYNITSATPAPAPAGQHCTHLGGTVDYQDGKGVRELDAVYCVNPPGRFGNWMSFANVTTIPQQFAASERATLSAIASSFTFDPNIVQHQAFKYSEPSREASIAAGKAATQRINAAHQAEAIQRSSVYDHWDSIDRRSQEFENYQLGYAVIADTGNNVHATMYQDDAALLVQQNPDKYELVSAPNYWKGKDY